MSDPVSGALIATAVVSAATGAFQGYTAHEASNAAGHAADEQKSQQDQLIEDQKNQVAQSKNEAQAIVTRDQQRDAFRSAQAQAQGRAGTILTTPLGIPSGVGAKTILGG